MRLKLDGVSRKNRRLICIGMFALLLVGSIKPLSCERADAYRTAKLINFQRVEDPAGAARAQAVFYMAIGVDDTLYHVRYAPAWKWSYEPTDLVVGDNIQVRLDKTHIYIQRPKGELKTYIVRRERHPE